MKRAARIIAAAALAGLPLLAAGAPEEYTVVGQQPRHPFVTPETFYMQVENLYDDTASDVHEGIFTVKHGYLYSFWTIDGKRLFAPEWKINEYPDPPRFESGAAVAINSVNKVAGKEVYSLLYPDGSVKQLDPNWTYVSQFFDGIALVEQTVNYKKIYFFINPRGEKVFSHLELRKATVKPMRRLSDGLRAVYFHSTETGKNWGFIDAQGNIVIPPAYNEVEDFHEGYCWVKSWMKPGKDLIDNKGNVVFHTDRSDRSDTGPVSDGIFWVDENGATVYYDVNTLKEISRQQNGNSFLRDRAFIGKNHEVSVVDRDFNVLKTFSTKVLNGVTTSQHGPFFGALDLGLDKVRTADLVLNPYGDIVLSDWSAEYQKYALGGFNPFTESGYCRLTWVKIDNKDYKALMDASGRIAWLFGTGESPDLSRLPDNPELPPRVSPQPWWGGLIDPEMPPIGPIKWTAHTFSVTVSHEGEGTASVSKASGIGYGDPVTLTAVPAEGWAIADIESNVGMPVAPGKPFAVTHDISIKVKFIKEEDIDNVPLTGAYQGTMHIQVNKSEGGMSDDITVYAELDAASGVESPYGSGTQGFIALMFDPTKHYVDKDFETYIFAAPLKVVGWQKDPASGREWIVAEGGNVTFGNLKVKPSDPLMYLYINLAMALDGHSSPDCIPRRYRIEVIDRNPDTGEFVFGGLDTYSTASGGWVDPESKEVTKVTKGLIVTKHDKGMPADLVKGVKMKQAPKRNDVCWYPPLVWYDNNESTLRKVVESMGNAYRNYKSDYGRLFGK